MSKPPTRVWVKDRKEVFVMADVVSAGWDPTADKLTVNLPNGTQKELPMAETQQFDPSHLLDVDDIGKMNNLDSAPLLNMLRQRFATDCIYSFVSQNVLISINPFKLIDGLYHDFSDLDRYGPSRMAHTYSIADKAFRAMLKTQENQSVVVNGESGAGKTEACKQVMEYLAHRSTTHSGQAAEEKVASEGRSLEDLVMACNPVLEAFGNAKTLRNDNSSRFGKFIRILYDGPKIIGAAMDHYLLEKSRVVHQSDEERNYHIFLQLLSAASPEQQQALHLQAPETYHYLSGGCFTVSGVDDVAEYRDTIASLTALGLPEESIDDILRVVAGILQNGNLVFEEDARGTVSVGSEPLEKACELLGCRRSAVYRDALLFRTIKSASSRRNSVYKATLNAVEANNARDALAKALYDKLFAWIVDTCNRSLSVESDEDNHIFIGILDIFGFEIFPQNSYEQLLINFANELLQKVFNITIFEAEKAVYSAEGLDCSYIDFSDNSLCVDLIEKKPDGIIPMLNEVCALGRDPNDANFLRAVEKQHDKRNRFFKRKSPKSMRDEFTIVHFAGPVTYIVDGFIEKNSDRLLDNVEAMLAQSVRPLISSLFRKEKSEGGSRRALRRQSSGKGKNKQQDTIGFKFKDQLHQLNTTLQETKPFYIRCIKPNLPKKPGLFDSPKCYEQLLCSGVLEVVKIRRMGYPRRETWEDLWQQFIDAGFALQAGVALDALPRAGVVAVLGAVGVGSEAWQEGKTLVFLKDSMWRQLDQWNQSIKVLVILTRYRMWIARKRYRRTRIKIKRIQRAWIVALMYKKYAHGIQAVVKVQARLRGARVQRRLRITRAATKLQSRWRGFMSRHLLKRQRAVIKLQSRARVRLAVKAYRAKRSDKVFRRALAVLKAKRRFKQRHGATVIQKYTRRHIQYWRFRKANAAVKLQARVRVVLAQQEYWAQIQSFRKAVTLINRVLRGMVKQRAYRKVQHALAVLQPTWRWKLKWHEFKQLRVLREMEKSGGKIRHRFYRAHRTKALAGWLEDVLHAITWGNVDEAADLLRFRDNRYRVLASIPDLVNVRDRLAQFKSLMHLAATSDPPNLRIAQLLLDANFTVDCVDATGATPLHKCAEAGDDRVQLAMLLVEHCRAQALAQASLSTLSRADRTAVAYATTTAFVIRRNHHTATAFDIAVARGHTRLAMFLSKHDGGAHQSSPMRREYADLLNAQSAQHLKDNAALVAERKARMSRLSSRQLKLLPTTNASRAQQPAAPRELTWSERQAIIKQRDPLYQVFMIQHQVKSAGETSAEDDRGGAPKEATSKARVTKSAKLRQSRYQQETQSRKTRKELARAAETLPAEGDEGGLLHYDLVLPHQQGTPSGGLRRNTQVIFEAAEMRLTSGDFEEQDWSPEQAAAAAELASDQEGEEGEEDEQSEADGKEQEKQALELKLQEGSKRQCLEKMCEDSELAQTKAAVSPHVQTETTNGHARSASAAKTTERKGAQAGPAMVEPVVPVDSTLKLVSDSASRLRRLSAFLWNEQSKPEQRGWHYRDEDGVEQGPFQSDWMGHWLAAGHFDHDTQVCYGAPGLWFGLDLLLPDREQDLACAFQLDEAATQRDAKKLMAFLRYRQHAGTGR